jgi:hypothetical protein
MLTPVTLRLLLLLLHRRVLLHRRHMLHVWWEAHVGLAREWHAGSPREPRRRQHTWRHACNNDSSSGGDGKRTGDEVPVPKSSTPISAQQLLHPNNRTKQQESPLVPDCTRHQARHGTSTCCCMCSTSCKLVLLLVHYIWSDAVFCSQRSHLVAA